MMGAQRPLIIPWLMEQLDAQRYPGVSWLNPERTQFRVPWKHGSRQSVSSEDFQLFEGWAIASGCYNPETDKRTPSEWKRNFRSALNRKSEIKVIENNSTDSEDPHKVFEFQSAVDLNNCDRKAENTVVADVPPFPAGHVGAYGGSSSSSQDSSLECMLNSLDLFNHEGVPVLGAEAPLCSEPFSFPSLTLAPPTTMLPPLEQILETKQLETDFEVRVYYRGQLVFNEEFSKVRGLCFLSAGSLGHYPDLADVKLPLPTNLSDELQVLYTNRILQNLSPGVLLRIEDTLLSGMRQGHCFVSWSRSEIPEAGMPCGQLSKKEFSSLYSLQHFVQELIGYMEGRNGSPNYTLWLCFGEDWPDASRSWKKKLVMVQVIPKAFEMLYELSQKCGASSLNGEPDLRISDSLQESQFLAQLKEFEERMEVELGS